VVFVAEPKDIEDICDDRLVLPARSFVRFFGAIVRPLYDTGKGDGGIFAFRTSILSTT
jgi:hypothetical protein